MSKSHTLGKVDRTQRGFELIEFEDYNGDHCSLQASSLAIYLKPGTSAIWLGQNSERTHPITHEKLGARMHLDRKQVAALIRHLEMWLKKGTFK